MFPFFGISNQLDMIFMCLNACYDSPTHTYFTAEKNGWHGPNDLGIFPLHMLFTKHPRHPEGGQGGYAGPLSGGSMKPSMKSWDVDHQLVIRTSQASTVWMDMSSV